MTGLLQLRISIDGQNVLEFGPGDSVMVPMDHDERALCRKALEGALLLLAQTVVTYPTFATADGKDGAATRTGQHLADCREGADWIRPSGRPRSSGTSPLRLVSLRMTETDCR